MDCCWLKARDELIVRCTATWYRWGCDISPPGLSPMGTSLGTHVPISSSRVRLADSQVINTKYLVSRLYSTPSLFLFLLHTSCRYFILKENQLIKQSIKKNRFTSSSSLILVSLNILVSPSMSWRPWVIGNKNVMSCHVHSKSSEIFLTH